MCTHGRVGYTQCWRDSHSNHHFRQQTSIVAVSAAALKGSISHHNLSTKVNRAVPPQVSLLRDSFVTATITGPMSAQGSDITLLYIEKIVPSSPNERKLKLEKFTQSSLIGTTAEIDLLIKSTTSLPCN